MLAGISTLLAGISTFAIASGGGLGCDPSQTAPARKAAAWAIPNVAGTQRCQGRIGASGRTAAGGVASSGVRSAQTVAHASGAGSWGRVASQSCESRASRADPGGTIGTARQVLGERG